MISRKAKPRSTVPILFLTLSGPSSTEFFEGAMGTLLTGPPMSLPHLRTFLHGKVRGRNKGRFIGACPFISTQLCLFSEGFSEKE